MHNYPSKATIEIEPKEIGVVCCTSSVGRKKKQRFLSIRGEDGDVEVLMKIKNPEELIASLAVALPFLKGKDVA